MFLFSSPWHFSDQWRISYSLLLPLVDRGRMHLAWDLLQSFLKGHSENEKHLLFSLSFLSRVQSCHGLGETREGRPIPTLFSSNSEYVRTSSINPVTGKRANFTGMSLHWDQVSVPTSHLRERERTGIWEEGWLSRWRQAAKPPQCFRASLCKTSTWSSLQQIHSCRHSAPLNCNGSTLTGKKPLRAFMETCTSFHLSKRGSWGVSCAKQRSFSGGKRSRQVCTVFT